MHEWLVAYTFKKVFWLKDIFFLSVVTRFRTASLAIRRKSKTAPFTPDLSVMAARKEIGLNV